MFSVALSVEKSLDLPPASIPTALARLRGIAPFGVRTFLFRLAPEAILRPSKTNHNLSQGVEVLKRQILRVRTLTYSPHETAGSVVRRRCVAP